MLFWGEGRGHAHVHTLTLYDVNLEACLLGDVCLRILGPYLGNASLIWCFPGREMARWEIVV